MRVLDWSALGPGLMIRSVGRLKNQLEELMMIIAGTPKLVVARLRIVSQWTVE